MQTVLYLQGRVHITGLCDLCQFVNIPDHLQTLLFFSLAFNTTQPEDLRWLKFKLNPLPPKLSRHILDLIIYGNDIATPKTSSKQLSNYFPNNWTGHCSVLWEIIGLRSSCTKKLKRKNSYFTSTRAPIIIK